MIKVRKLEVGQLRTNCYLVIEDRSCQIIDPGDDADYITRIITDEDATPTVLIATHGHYDHILAATELKLAYNIPYLMHKADKFLLSKMASSAKHFSGVNADPPPEVDKYIEDGDVLKIENCKLKIMETPGHTPGSVTLYSRSGNIAFVGDLIFEKGGVGRIDFSYSDEEKLKESIDNILKLPDETIIYPGHGGKFSIGQAKKYFTS